METSNIHILQHEIPQHTDTFSKGSSSCVHSASATSWLQPVSSDSCTESVCEESICSHPLPGTPVNAHLLHPLCHLFSSLEESCSILSFLTRKLLHNSRSSSFPFPKPWHTVPFVCNTPQVMRDGFLCWIFYCVVFFFIPNHVFALF